MTDRITPLPWKTGKDTGVLGMYCADGRKIFSCLGDYTHSEEDQANADYIVHCANNYTKLEALNAELVKALSDLTIESEGFIKCHEWVIRNDHGNSNINVMQFRIEAAKAALEKAKGVANG